MINLLDPLINRDPTSRYYAPDSIRRLARKMPRKKIKRILIIVRLAGWQAAVSQFGLREIWAADLAGRVRLGIGVR